MRVLYLNHTAQVSGGECSLLDLLTALPPGIEPIVASPRGGLEARLREAGVEHRPVPGTAGSLRLHPLHTPRAGLELVRAARAVRSLIREVAPDVVHANSIRAGVIAGLGMRDGAPLVVHVRDALPPGLAANAALGLIGRRAAVLVANSHYTAERLSRSSPRAPVRVVYSPVDARRFDPARVVPAPFPRMDGELVLGLVGQITPWKGQREAVEMMALLERRGVEARLVLVGSTTFVDRATRFDNRAYLAELRSRIAALGLEGRVTLLGARDDVPELMAAFDLVLAPSWEEPMGRAVLEAMAMERPVIATSVGGPAELVQEGESGLLLDPRRADLWADAIARLASDEPLRRELGRQGRRRVLDNFALERHASRIVSAYEAVSATEDAGRG
jgi:L-malate glycosyltransferase